MVWPGVASVESGVGRGLLGSVSLVLVSTASSGSAMMALHSYRCALVLALVDFGNVTLNSTGSAGDCVGPAVFAAPALSPTALAALGSWGSRRW